VFPVEGADAFVAVRGGEEGGGGGGRGVTLMKIGSFRPIVK